MFQLKDDAAVPDKVSELTSLVSSQSAQINKLFIQYTQANQDKERLCKDLNDLRSNINSLTLELKRSQKSNERLTKQNDKLFKENEKLKGQLSKYQSIS